MNEVKPVALTPGGIVILRTLENGPVKWSPLRKAYFGPLRSEQSASTAFYMKVKDFIKKGLVKKTDTGDAYEITELGLVSIAAVPEATKLAAKSEAQIRFEASDAGKAAAKVAAEAEAAKGEKVA